MSEIYRSQKAAIILSSYPFCGRKLGRFGWSVQRRDTRQRLVIEISLRNSITRIEAMIETKKFNSKYSCSNLFMLDAVARVLRPPLVWGVECLCS